MLAAALALFVAVALVRILAVAASPTSQVSPAPRTVLRTDPTRGAAIVALLRDGGVESGSFRHHAVASRRAPRFLASRAWLADHHLRAGRHAQPLVLPPGGYQLEMRVRAQSLRSSQGLEWTLSCHRSPRPFATSDALSGDFDWRRFVFAFEVPSEACDGQWLRLDNPAPGGSAGIVTGDLWIDDLVLTRVDRPAESITTPSAPD